jgi:hypothetical protein
MKANSPGDLVLQTSEAEIAEEFQVRRSLNEKVVKRDRYIWKFHKNDPDHWPSDLHGHDYDKGVKLDAYTGDIYDVGTRQRCMKLNQKALNRIRQDLQNSKDFADRFTDEA